MRKSFWLPITPGPCGLPRAAPPGAVRAAVQAHRGEARADRPAKRKEGVLTTDDPALQHPHRGLQGEISAHRAAARPRPARPRPPEREELLEVRDRLEEARDRLERPAQRAGHRPQGAGRPAGGDLQGRHARRAHGDARGRRLRRPARARRVPRPHLRPGPRDHRRGARSARQGPRRRPWSWPTLEEPRADSPPSASCASATRSPQARDQLLSLARPSCAQRAQRAPERSPRCRTAGWPSRATWRRSRPSRPACRRHSRGWPAPGPVRQRHRPADLAGERPGRLALRHALGPPARRHRHRRGLGHPDPRRRLGHAWC